MSPDPESGKAARPEPIIERIRDELDDLGYGPNALVAGDGLSWDDPDHRRMVREAFDDGGADEAIWPGFGPTGHAENAREDCGEAHPFVCDACGQSVQFGRTCKMSMCTRCARVWARDLGAKKAAKLRRVRKEQHYAIDELWQKLHHLVISPPPDWFYLLAKAGLSRDEALELTREISKFILSELRAQGLLVRHSYRLKKGDGSLRKDEHSSKGVYKDLLFDGLPWFGDPGVRNELAWKPHDHAIVVCDNLFLKGDDDTPSLAKVLEEATGWVLHRIEDDSGTSLANDGAMAGAVTYTISHADIMIRDRSSNRSAIWEVGAFEGDPIRSSSRFSPSEADLAWGDEVVRRKAAKILGITSSTTDCGTTLPGVDDPDLLAKKILDELYPDDDVPNYSSAAVESVLYHVAEGDLQVDVSTSAGGGGSIDVRMAGAGTVDLPRIRGSTELPRGESTTDLPSKSGSSWSTPPEPSTLAELLDEDDCGCGDDHDEDDDQDGDDVCSGTLIPLDEARQRGLLDDPEWLRNAANADEAQETDREWPDDLDPWQSKHPGKASPAIG